MSDAFNQSWTLLKTRRGAGYSDDRIRRQMQEFVDSMRGKIPADRTRMQQDFMMQMEHALDNDQWYLYENIRDRAEEEIGREMANEASEFALANHLASQKEEQRGLTTFEDEELQSMIEELDEADLKSQQEEQPDEIIARHARDTEMAGGEPFIDTREMATAFEEEFGHTGVGRDAYKDMNRQSIDTLKEMLIHHILTPFAHAMSLNEFQREMRTQLGRDATSRLTEMAEEEIDNMSDVEREQRRRYAEAGGSPGAAGNMLGAFEDNMLDLMNQMADPSKRDGSGASNQLEELTLTVGDLFGDDAASMMRERALEAHAESTRLPLGHPARIIPGGRDRLPPHWRQQYGYGGVEGDVSQLGLQEFDKNLQLTNRQRDDIRYLANLDPRELPRRAPHQRTMANRRIEQRGGKGSGDFALVADDETGKTHQIARTNASLHRPTNLVSGLSSDTTKPHRRQRAYRDLLLGLLNAGFQIQSDSRNRDYSNPFHTNLLQTLPPSIEATINEGRSDEVDVEELLRRQAIIDQGGPLAVRYRRGDDRSTLPITTGDVIRYRKNIEEIPNWGDLRPDRGAIPIVTVDKPKTPVNRTMDVKPKVGRAAKNFYDRDKQTTFNISSNPYRPKAEWPSIEQRAMGIRFELPNTQDSVLRPATQMAEIGYGHHPFFVNRKDVPFPAVSEQPAFADVAQHMRARDFAEVYGLPYPTPDEVVAAHENLPLGHFPPLLTEDQKAAIRQLTPLAPPPPPPPPPPQADEMDSRTYELSDLFR